MEFRILGPLEVLDGSRVVQLGGQRKRAVLAILLLRPNRVVAGERLIEELWGERPPATALQTVRVHISQIRKVLGRDLVRTLPSGYVLELDPDELDARRFEGLFAEGIAAMAVGEAAAAARTLREALALWRGPALADFVYEPFAQAEIARLEELRLAALEARIDADLALGAHVEIVAELQALISEHPLRDRFRAQLMLALYRAGRQSDALGAYRDARRTLVEELGIEPSAELRGLERAILHQDASLGGGWPPSQVVPQPSVRKQVTALHVELEPAGAEEPDPEALARQLTGPLEQVRDVVGEHEGSVLAREVDAVTAAFGLPSLHEDDALRAVRAAVDLRDRLADYHGFEHRMGIATGEVVASGEAMTVGAVGGAATRLAHVARAGDIVLDDPTKKLVANAVEVERLEGPFAFRLLSLLPGAPPFARRLEAPLIGRRAELAQLIAAFERTVAGPEPALLLLAGPPGIGKSRLAGELLGALADHATALVGRCLSYGQGITLWPLREMVREAAGDDTRAAVGTLLRREPDARVVADRIAAAFGHADVDRPAEEMVWAFRRLFEALARSRPHVLVVEDAHWAEPALLDLLEYVSRQAQAVPLLIVCLARPELLEVRPGLASAAIELEPLSSVETEALIDNLPLGPSLTREMRNRVVTLAEGNPLFAEQFVALLASEGGTAPAPVSPTIQAILAARLDRLGPGERTVAERAAVVGREFALEAVTELLPARAAPHAGRHLEALTRKRLVQSDRSVLPGKTGFRFQHALIHDAAYRRLPKALRAELHERLADWLERAAGSRIADLEEVVGYHLERAYRYRVELGADRDSVAELACSAAARLAAAGRRAFQRTDFRAAVALLTRALELMPEDDPAGVELLDMVGTALVPLGELERATVVLDETVRRARRLRNRQGEWQARIERRWIEYASRPAGVTPEQFRRHAERGLRVFEELGDPLGAARASVLISSTLIDLGRGRAAEDVAGRALSFARASGVHREEVRAQWALMGALHDGPTPVPAAIARCAELLADAPDSLVGTVGVSGTLGVLHAMNGQFDTARELVGRARSILEAIAHPRPLSASAHWAGRVEVLAGELTRAETCYRDGLAIAREIGDRDRAAPLGLRLAEVLCLQGSAEEARSQLDEVPRPGAGVGSARWLSTRARVLAMEGGHARAKSVASDAVALVASTDLLDLRADVELTLAEVLWADGSIEAATAARDSAIGLYDQKGNLAAAAHALAVVPAHLLA